MRDVRTALIAILHDELTSNLHGEVVPHTQDFFRKDNLRDGIAFPHTSTPANSFRSPAL
jgi:hypothetical protein